MAGLTSEGLVIKRLADVKSDLEQAIIAAFGPATNVAPDSVFGQLIGVFAQPTSQVWELAQQIVDAFDPDQAEGALLDNLASLVGVSRLPATFSTGEITATGSEGTVIDAGSVVEVSATGTRFETVVEATIPAAGTVDIGIRGEETGPLQAPAGTIDTIVTPIAGWDSVTNAEDITPGTDVETDAALRIRREESLQITGAAVDEAIRAQLRQIEGVQAALVISNRSSADPDANGIPAHAFETIIWPDPSDPAFNAEIAETIFRLQPAGIQAFGDNVFDVTDQEGFTQQVAFTFATELEMFVDADIIVDANYPADGDQQVADALLAEGNLLSVGDDVLVWKFEAALDPIPGILDVTVEIDQFTNPINTDNIAVAFDEIALFDSARIEVTST